MTYQAEKTGKLKSSKVVHEERANGPKCNRTEHGRPDWRSLGSGQVTCGMCALTRT